MTHSWRRTWPIMALTLFGAALRFALLSHQGLWYDEAYTAFLMKQSVGGMLGLLPHQESTPPLYYCVAWVWTHVFGDTAAGLRSLSALCGTATIPVVYVATRRLLNGERAALIAAALTACNPLLFWYSQEARAYSLLVLLSACSLAAFAHCLSRPSLRHLVLWAIASILALLTHYYAALIIVPEAAWLLGSRARDRNTWLAVGAVGLAGVGLLPLLIAQTRSDHFGWISHIPLSLRAGQVLPLALLGTGAPAREALKLIAFAAVLVGLVLLALRAGRRERDGARIAAVILAAGLALAALSMILRDTFLARNLLPLWIPAAIVVAAGFAATRARMLGAATAAVLCAVGVVAVIGVDSEYRLQRPDWPAVAAALGPAPAHGQRIVLVQRLHGLLPLGIYLPRLHWVRDRSLADVSEIDVIAQRSPEAGRACWWGSACNLPGSALQRVYAIPGFARTGAPARIKQFRLLRLSATRPRTVTAASVRRALTETRLNGDGFLVQR